MPTKPKFSIIAVDYDGHVPREGMDRGLRSLANQTFKDFELIIVHDGPKQKPYKDETDLSIFPSPPLLLEHTERVNDWGHTGRDSGMRQAKGDYILHFNIDNILYPDCLKIISDKIDETASPIVIFTIKHYKINGGTQPFSGLPPVWCNIDALQLVAKREIWEEMNYWYDRHETSDGRIYEQMCKRYPYVHIGEVLAENY